jgi:hypothetical protein
MKIEILVSSALIDQGKDEWAGLHEHVEVPEKRGAFLVSIGAAREVKAPAKAEKKTAPAAEEKKAPAPRRAAPKTK